MNVWKALITAIAMQLAKMLKEVSHALVTLDFLAMDLFARVNASINLFLEYINQLCTSIIRCYHSHFYVF